jgi:hypothetical protein
MGEAEVGEEVRALQDTVGRAIQAVEAVEREVMAGPRKRVK